MAIKERTGASHGAIRKTLDLYAADGAPALRPKTRGRRKGTAKRLADEQEKDIRNAIRDRRPELLKMEFAQLRCAQTMVASTPERVKSCFKDKHVSYAADSQ